MDNVRLARAAAPIAALGTGRRGRGLVRRKPLGAISLVFLVGLVVVALAADLIAPYGYNEPLRGHRLESPSPQFPLGTDHLSRDVLSRIIYGSRVTLVAGAGSVALGTLGGALIGLISAYARGPMDQTTQRFMEALMALPTMVLALSIVAAIGPGLLNVIIAIGVSQVPAVNRIVRGVALAELTNVYIEAARTVGCGALRIIVKHLLPNVTAPIIVLATVNLALAIVVEASLSFLGVGTPDPIPSWGGMLTVQSQRYMLAQPWTAVWPGLAISLVVLAWNLLGDAMRDVLDPRLRGYGS